MVPSIGLSYSDDLALDNSSAVREIIKSEENGIYGVTYLMITSVAILITAMVRLQINLQDLCGLRTQTVQKQ